MAEDTTSPVEDTTVTDPEPVPAPEPKPTDGKPSDGDRPNPVKQLREQLRREQDEKKALEQRLRALEDKDLSEQERTRKENEELKPIRDEHGRFRSALQDVIDGELASIPEDKREQVAALMGDGPLDRQLSALRAAKSLLPSAPAAAPPPVQAGTTTRPAAAAQPSVDEQIAAAQAAGNAPLAIALKRKAAGLGRQ